MTSIQNRDSGSINIRFGPSVIFIHHRCHPDVDCPFDYDWLRASASLNGIGGELDRFRAVEAEDLAQFQADLLGLLAGAPKAVLSPVEEPFTVEVTRTVDETFKALFSTPSVSSTEASVTARDIRDLIGALSDVLRVYPPRRALQTNRA